MRAALALFTSACLGALTLAAPANAEIVAPPDVTALAEQIAVPMVDDQEVIVGACPGDATALGCTWMKADVPIYLVYSDDWFTLYHEFGHRFDFAAMTSRARVRFAGLLGQTWRAGGKWGDKLVEAFADAYAFCARNPTRLVQDVRAPTPNRHMAKNFRRVCRLIEDTGVRAGLA